MPVVQPLHLAHTLESGQAFRWVRAGSDEGEEGQWFRGVILDNVVEIGQVPGGMEFRCAPEDESKLLPLIRDYLRLDDDLEAIYASITVDGRIGTAIAEYRGMRVLRQEPWECLVSFICSANSNISRISANLEAMSIQFGRLIGLPGRQGNTFPTPTALAEAGEEGLRKLGLGFRAKYVASVARTVADGGFDLVALREVPYEEALDALTTLPGVGDKVANCALLFSLDKLEAFPVDVWVHRAVQERYPNSAERPLPRKDMRAWAQDHFGPYAGYANQYLFHQRRLQGRGRKRS